MDSQRLGFPSCKEVMVCSFHDPGSDQSSALIPVLLVPSIPTPGLEWGQRPSQSASEPSSPLSILQASAPVILRTPTEVRVLKPFCTLKNGGSERVGSCTRITQHMNNVEMGPMG